MRNYSLKTRENSRPNSKQRILISVLLLTALVVLLISFGGTLFGRALATIVYPYHATRHWLTESTAILPSYLRSRNDLLEEIATYQNDIAKQAANATLIKKLQSENQELRELLSATDTERIAASVIARPPFLPYDAYLIDRGEADGIKVGSLVYYHNNYALGYVTKTFSQSALVTLYSAPRVRFTAYVMGPNIFANARGEGGGVIRVSVPQGVMLKAGNVVIAPGIHGGLIGSISSVTSEPTEPEQHGFVTLPIPLQSVRMVAISSATLETVSFSEAVDAIEAFATPALTFTLPTSTLLFPGQTTSTPTSTSVRIGTTTLVQ